jgi:hypothetical protein
MPLTNYFGVICNSTILIALNDNHTNFIKRSRYFKFIYLNYFYHGRLILSYESVYPAPYDRYRTDP